MALLTAACAGGGAPGPSQASQGPSQPSPRANALQVTLDSGRSGSSVATISGGFVFATSADGATYSLNIPAGALLLDTQITLTPILSAAGLPEGAERIVGVRLEPEGMDFLAPVTLEIELGSTWPEGETIGLMADGAGSELHEYPITKSGSRVSASLFHFSDAWVAGGRALEGMRGALAALGLTLARSEFARDLAELIRSGQAEELERRIREFYTDHIAPLLANAATSCDSGKRVIPLALMWAHFASLGFGEFQAESRAIIDATILWLRHCVDETRVECLDGSTQANLHVGYIRQLAIMGETATLPPACENGSPTSHPTPSFSASCPPPWGCGG